MNLTTWLAVATFAAPLGATGDTLVLEDRLTGSAVGEVVGGRFSEFGFVPCEGPATDHHVLYRLSEPISAGALEFEVKGLDPALAPADADVAFFGMYDGRGVAEPATYFEGFKQNHARWNLHWRAGRNVVKGVVLASRPDRTWPSDAPALFEEGGRDWFAEPNGAPVDWRPDAWHRIRAEWGGGRFEAFVDGATVWRTEGPFPQTPREHRIWLGSAPGYGTKYRAQVPGLTYRNFRVWRRAPAQESPMNPPATIPPSNGAVAFGAPWTSPYRVDPVTRFHFVNDEGTYLFPLSKTAWTYFGCQDPVGVAAKARSQGVNVLRVALEGAPYFPVLGTDLWPWGGTRKVPDFDKLDADYWSEVERRVRIAGEHGLGLDVVLYFTLKPAEADFPRHERYLREVARRLGRYANVLVYEIANEHVRNEGFQDRAGSLLKALDPRRPVTTSDGTTDDAVWPGKPWMDVATNHSCTGSHEGYPLDAWYLAVARNTRAHGKPAWCNESGRENRHRNDDGVHRRKQSWLWTTAGAFWNYHSWEGCEGIDDLGYRGPGQEFLAPLAAYWRSVAFWTLAPNHTALRWEGAPIGAAMASADRSLAVAYLCAEASGSTVAGAQLRLDLPAGRYEVLAQRPADLGVAARTEVDAEGLRRPQAIPLPDFQDDLVVTVRRLRPGDRNPVPGTG